MRSIERLEHSDDYATDQRAYVDATWAVRVAVEDEQNVARLVRWRARFGPAPAAWTAPMPRRTATEVVLARFPVRITA